MYSVSHLQSSSSLEGGWNADGKSTLAPFQKKLFQPDFDTCNNPSADNEMFAPAEIAIPALAGLLVEVITRLEAKTRPFSRFCPFNQVTALLASV